MTDMFSQILNMSLTGSVVILFILAARLGLKRAPKIFSYALWSVVLFRLLCPVSLPSPVSVLEMTKPQVTEVQGITSSVSYLPAQVTYANAQADPIPVFVAEAVQREMSGTNTPFSLMSIAVILWLTGIAIMVTYSIISYARLRRNLIGAVPCRGNVYRADYIASPFVLGILRPRIYLPSDTPMEEVRFIVAHERHHIRRGDHIIKLMAYGALCLHWFNPLVWVSFVLAGKDMEMSCDEAVLRKLGPQVRADYSASLLRLATGHRIIAGTPLAFGEGDTKGRVKNMAKWKKPKLWVSAICLLLCAAILMACGMNPQETTEKETAAVTETETAEAIAFEKVKTVFDTVQAGACQILQQQKNEGNEGPSGYLSTYCHADGNWVSVTEMVLAGTNRTEEGEYYNRQAYLYHEGFYYSNEGHWGEQGAIQWTAWSGEEIWKPTLASFQWNTSSVTYLDTATDESGECLRFRIDQKYVDHETYTNHYFADFYFDTEGNFRNVQILVNQNQDNAFTVTESIVSLDAGAVAEQIQSYYGYGIPVAETKGKPVVNGGNIVTNAELVQYGALQMALHEGCGCREDNGSVILTMDGADVGGITCWQAPDFSLTNVRDREWMRAMGLPEAQQTNEPIAYMSGNGAYGDLEAEFFHELELEKLNVRHEFFFVDDLVYDVYYNQNILTRTQAEKFLETIQIAGEPVVTPEPSKEESLIKCRNVLSLIQSGSFCVASDRTNRGTIALNDYAFSRYWQEGENWLSITEIPESGASSFFYYMEVDGTHYNTERTGWDENGPIWAEQQPVEVGKPWLATFRWNDETVGYMDTLINGGEECVMLRIDEPYPYGADNAEFYFVNFYFADGGVFLRADVQVNLFMDNAFDLRETIVTLDAQTVAAEIEAQHTRAMEAE